MEQKILSLKDDKIHSEVELFEYPTELRGGRNLIKNSKGYFSTNATRSFSILPYKFAGAYINMSFEYEIINGNTGSVLNSRRIGFEFRVNHSDGTYSFPGVWEVFPPNEVGITKSGVCSIKHLIKDKAISTFFSNVLIYPTFIVGEKVVMSNLKIERGSTPTPWSPAPEDLDLTYPDFITEFKPSISDRYILTEELFEYPTELRGGRNLLLNSDSNLFGDGRYGTQLIDTYLGVKNVIEITSPQNTMYFTPAEKYSESLKAGEKYILSFLFTYEGSKGMTPQIYLSSNTGGYQYVVGDIEEGKFNRVYVNINPTSDHRARFHMHLSGYGTAYIAGIKLEKGNKATDWTPAPEDLGLSYPDNIQSFGTSFSNNILINEFIEQ